MTLVDITNNVGRKRQGESAGKQEERPPLKKRKLGKENMGFPLIPDTLPALEPTLHNTRSMDGMRRELWNVRAELPEAQLALEKLKKELEQLQDSFDAKEKMLDAMDEGRVQLEKSLEEEFAMHVDVEQKRFDQQVEALSKEYSGRAKDLVEKKQAAFDKQQAALGERKKELEAEVEGIDAEFARQVDALQEQFKLMRENEKLSTQKSIREAECELAKLDPDIASFERELAEIGQDSGELAAQREKLQRECDKLQQNQEVFEKQTVELRAAMAESISELAAEQSKKAALAKELEQLRANIVKYKMEAIDQEALGRKLREKVQTLKGNIRVFCRVKPEKDEDSFDLRFLEGAGWKEGLEIRSHAARSRSYRFFFDKVFGRYTSNVEIFDEISQLVQSALDGFNVCIFAYGQTGSGKTYTMVTPEDGMISRSVKQVFERIEEAKQQGWKYKVTGQFLEIYGDSVNDLMAKSYLHNLDSGRVLIKHIEAKQRCVVTNVTKVDLHSPEQVAKCLDTANGKRSTASTKMNQRSSRSHFVFILELSGTNQKTGRTVFSTLNLVDLAGSERISQSKVTGVQLREALAINKSLSALGDVVLALKNNAQHIPYRNSKLTYLLQYSLGGNSKTLMFVNIAANAKYFNETLNSLRFAEKVNCTHIGRASSVE